MPRLKSDKWSSPVVRFGIGYDIHPFKPKRKLVLGGVRIPHDAGLDGHSDADVLLHAICDALLGAAALGDIGKHFPNTKRAYKNISSLLLLARVGKLLTRHHFQIVNVDSTVILERPKILRHSPAMIRNVARALKISPQQISIKATTQEGLGSLGRGEGCAALAVAAIISKNK